MPQHPVKLEVLAAAARLSMPDGALIEVAGKTITAKDLKTAIAEPLAELTRLPDTQILTGKGTSFTVGEAKREVGEIASKRPLAKQRADTALKKVAAEARLHLDQERSAILSANGKQISRLPGRLTGNPAEVHLHVLNFGTVGAATAPPQVTGVFGAGTETHNRFYPNMSMAILGSNFGGTPGRVLIQYQKFDGTTTEAEMFREHLGANHSGPDWSSFVLLMRIPELTGFLRQSAAIKLIRSDGERTQFGDIPLEPFGEFFQLSQQNAPTLDFQYLFWKVCR